MSKVHKLKILTDNFKDVVGRRMTYQLRKDDRDFSLGDILYLQEFQDGYFTGRAQVCKVNHIVRHGEGIAKDYVLLNIKLLSAHIPVEGESLKTNTISLIS